MHNSPHLSPDEFSLVPKKLCADLGRQLPGGGAISVVCIADLVVAIASILQRLTALEAVVPCRADFLNCVVTSDGMPAGAQLHVT